MMHLFRKIKSRIKDICFAVKYIACINSNKNIVFILHSNNHKSGGDKVVYRQSEVISKLNINGITGQILHPENPSFSHKWFKHEATFRKSLQLDPIRDFVVIPEIWVLPHAKLLNDIGVKYAIYVQNGYLTNIPMLVGHEYEDLKTAYNKASLILSISDDTIDCIKLAFPELETEIIRIYYSVDSEKFKIAQKKENLITFMPRKLSSHSQMLLFFLKNALPKHWKIEAIDGLNEEGVRDILSRSKIFLSFSEFEGCPLPPVEAALSGNQVIGYTGEGAKEYWDLSMFTEVHCGDIRNYVKQILIKIEQLEKNSLINIKAIDTLAKKYNREAEITSISKFVNIVNSRLELEQSK
jgi:hypothetical protein